MSQCHGEQAAEDSWLPSWMSFPTSAGEVGLAWAGPGPGEPDVAPGIRRPVDETINLLNQAAPYTFATWKHSMSGDSVIHNAFASQSLERWKRFLISLPHGLYILRLVSSRLDVLRVVTYSWPVLEWLALDSMRQSNTWRTVAEKKTAFMFFFVLELD